MSTVHLTTYVTEVFVKHFCCVHVCSPLFLPVSPPLPEAVIPVVGKLYITTGFPVVVLHSLVGLTTRTASLPKYFSLTTSSVSCSSLSLLDSHQVAMGCSMYGRVNAMDPCTHACSNPQLHTVEGH